MNTKNKKQAHYQERKEFALRKCRECIEYAKVDLYWARFDRLAGAHSYCLESMACVAHYREKALWWYARYQKYCGKLAQLEAAKTMYVISYIDPDGFILKDRVPADQLQITLDSLRLLGCTHILYGKEVA